MWEVREGLRDKLHFSAEERDSLMNFEINPYCSHTYVCDCKCLIILLSTGDKDSNKNKSFLLKDEMSFGNDGNNNMYETTGIQTMTTTTTAIELLPPQPFKKKEAEEVRNISGIVSNKER